MRIRRIKIRKERMLAGVLSVYYTFLLLVNFSLGYEASLGIDQTVVSQLAKAALVCLAAFFLPIIAKYINRRTFYWVIVSILVIICNILFFPMNRQVFIETSMTFITTCLFYVLVITEMQSYSCLREALIKVKQIGIIFSYVVIFCNLIPGILPGFHIEIGYSMGLGYSLLLPILMQIDQASKTKRIYEWIPVVAMLSIVFIYASRGPFVSVAAFLCIVFLKKSIASRKWVLFFVGCAIIVVLLLLSHTIFLFISDVLDYFGIYSRNMMYFVENLGFSSRVGIYGDTVKEICKSPFIVHGINGEYALGIGYPHNFLLELLFQFGIVFGGIIIVFIFLGACQSIKNYLAVENDKTLIEVIFLCMSVPTLIFSGTLWTMPAFWIWVAIMMSGRCMNRGCYCKRNNHLVEAR